MEAFTLRVPDVLTFASVNSPTSFEVLRCRTSIISTTDAVEIAARFGLTATFVRSLASTQHSKWVKVERVSRQVATQSRVGLGVVRSKMSINSPLSACTARVAGRCVSLVRVLFSHNTSPQRTAHLLPTDSYAVPTLALRGFKNAESVQIAVPSPNHASYGIVMPFDADGHLMSDACLFVMNMPSAAAWSRCQYLDTLADAVAASSAASTVSVTSTFEYLDVSQGVDARTNAIDLTVDELVEYALTRDMQFHHELVQRLHDLYISRYAQQNEQN